MIQIRSSRGSAHVESDGFGFRITFSPDWAGVVRTLRPRMAGLAAAIIAGVTMGAIALLFWWSGTHPVPGCEKLETPEEIIICGR